MENQKGYVYVGRLIDHTGNILSNYQKIGKTINLKSRETSLNSTHLPMDVLFVRAFETSHMDSLERILHTTFNENRVQKEYEWRRNITTEWFDVDSEIFHNKINDIVKYFPDTEEVNMLEHMNNDQTVSDIYKQHMNETIQRSRNASKLELFIKGQNVTEGTGKMTLCRAIEYICDIVGWDVVDESEFYLTKDISEFQDNYEAFSSNMYQEIRDGYYMWTAISNKAKLALIQKLIKKYQVKNIECNFSNI